MAGLNPKSLIWLDQLATLRAQPPSANRAQLKEALKLPNSQISGLRKLEGCLDPTAIEKVRQAAQADPPYILSYRSAVALAGLNGRVNDLFGSFHAALDVILVQRLATKHIKNLVVWIAGGKPASEFDPSVSPLRGLAQSKLGTRHVASSQINAKLPYTTEEITVPDSIESEPEEESTQRTKFQKSKNETFGQRIGDGIDQIVNFFGWVQGQTHEDGSTKASGRRQPKTKRTQKGLKPVVHWFKKAGEKFAKGTWKELIKVEHHVCRKLACAIVPLHASHSTGSGRSHSSRSRNSGSIRQGLITLFLTVLHWVVYALLQYSFLLAVAAFLICPFAPALKPWVEWPFHFAAHVAVYNFPAFVWANAQTHLGPTLVISGLLVLGFYYAWKAEPLRISLLGIALGYLIVQGRGFADLPSPWSKSVASETANGNNNEPLAKPSLSPQLVVSAKAPKHQVPVQRQMYQPSTSFQTGSTDAATATTLYDAKLLEQEIEAVPKNSIIKAYPLMVDETMPGDLAVSRLQDLTDPDKYTMKIGSDTEKILSVNATTTNFIVYYKSTDPFKFLDGAGPLNLFWEDVLYIHADEIDGKSGSVIYQCSLVVKGAKNVFTVQCASSDDLKHLVSTMEYFIRASRLAHDTALAGMPYPHQGMRLNDKNLVEVLWANSPANKSGLTLGDMVWSVEKNTTEQSDRKKLETQLSALTVGPHDLYIVSPADRNAGLVQMNANNSSVFNPKRHKVVLTVL